MTVLSNLSSSLWRGIQCDAILLSSGSLPTRQVQMFDVAIPLVVGLVLSASYILPPSSSPASFFLVFLLIFFLAFSLRLPFLTVILLLECVCVPISHYHYIIRPLGSIQYFFQPLVHTCILRAFFVTVRAGTAYRHLFSQVKNFFYLQCILLTNK